jgi:signal transduction histidine kinase
VMPRAIAETIMDAIERAVQGDPTIVLEYELPLPEVRQFEARIVSAGGDRVLSIVRDVTDAKRAAELNRDLAGRLIASQEVERRRIARELHDDLSQKLALLMINIDQVAIRVGAERDLFHGLSTQAGEIASAIHNLSHELHPSKLHALGLLSALQSLCRDVSQQGGVQVAFTHGFVPKDVDGDVSLCLYRITQEALHNVARHSQARHAEVRLSAEADLLTLQVADSGVGFSVKRQQDGLGLVSIRERVTLLRGQLAIHTFPGGGTRIGVRVPVSRTSGG